MVLGPSAPSHEPPQRFDVGEEVDVAIDGESVKPPYDKGWKRGVILFKQCSADDDHVRALLPRSYLEGLPPDMGFAYLVRLHDGAGHAPAHFDDPDFIRGVDPKYANDAPTGFKPGDSVECQVGPDEWHRGVVRECRVPYAGWGRGWTEDGDADETHEGPKDTVAYLVTPSGVEYDSGNPMSTIMVPGDRDCFVRSFDATERGDDAYTLPATYQPNPHVTDEQHEELRGAFSELASSAIEVPMGAAEGAEMTKYCAPQMKRTVKNLDAAAFDAALAAGTVPSRLVTVMFNGETRWDARPGETRFGTCVTMVKNSSCFDVLLKDEKGEVTTLDFGGGCGVMRTVNPGEKLRVARADGADDDDADLLAVSFTEF
jgi:hypothetical protein